MYKEAVLRQIIITDISNFHLFLGRIMPSKQSNTLVIVTGTTWNPLLVKMGDLYRWIDYLSVLIRWLPLIWEWVIGPPTRGEISGSPAHVTGLPSQVELKNNHQLTQLK